MLMSNAQAHNATAPAADACRSPQIRTSGAGHSRCLGRPEASVRPQRPHRHHAAVRRGSCLPRSKATTAPRATTRRRQQCTHRRAPSARRATAHAAEEPPGLSALAPGLHEATRACHKLPPGKVLERPTVSPWPVGRGWPTAPPCGARSPWLKPWERRQRTQGGASLAQGTSAPCITPDGQPPGVRGVQTRQGRVLRVFRRGRRRVATANPWVPPPAMSSASATVRCGCASRRPSAHVARLAPPPAGHQDSQPCNRCQVLP